MNPSDRFVYIVAADPLARGGLAAVLQDAPGWRIKGQSDATSALRFLSAPTTELPDLIIWDTGWNLQQSTELLGALDHETLNAPIVALVAEPDHAWQVWQSGAEAILSRDVDSAALLAAMQAVVAGLRVFAPEFIAALDIAAPDIDNANLSRSPLPEPLTPREMDVLQLVAQGLPNKTIARRLEISEHTVKFHMNAILGKLNAQSRTEAVVNAGRAGIIQV